MVTWDPVEQEGEGDHMEEVGVGSVQPQLSIALSAQDKSLTRNVTVLTIHT